MTSFTATKSMRVAKCAVNGTFDEAAKSDVNDAFDRSRNTIKALDAARDRLDAATDLLNRALDLRERLWFGADLDLMVDEVQAFKRACDAYRRWLT